MINKYSRNISWDFLSKIIMISFIALQFIRWDMLLESVDIYYHLLTAWGFIQAGGYSSWDFWQYAPVGRIHIYPPFFHLILAAFIKLGAQQIILAKLCEVLLPWVFLCVLWYFIKVHYSRRLGLFVVLVFFSPFSFYLSLLNHIPATLAFIFGILSLDQLFKNKLLRSAVLLGVCFYTHIGLPWFFVLALIFYALLNKEIMREALFVVFLSFILALPILIQEFNGLKSITTFGISLHEKYLSQIKVVDLMFAAAGLVIALRRKEKYMLFLSLYLASLIFLAYPYRFFCRRLFTRNYAFGGFFDTLYQKFNNKYLFLLIAVFTLLVSPTLSLHKHTRDKHVSYSFNFFDTGFVNLRKALWFPEEFISTANMVKENTSSRDIIFCSLNYIGLAIASLSGRASANALLPEIKLTQNYKPLASSKIIILSQIDDPQLTDKIINTFRLIKVGENEFFAIYKNPVCSAQVKINKAGLTFRLISGIGLLVLLAYWLAGKVERPLYNFIKNI